MILCAECGKRPAKEEHPIKTADGRDGLACCLCYYTLVRKTVRETKKELEGER